MKTIKYDELQERVLKNLTTKERLEVLERFTGGNADQYFIDIYSVLFSVLSKLIKRHVVVDGNSIKAIYTKEHKKDYNGNKSLSNVLSRINERELINDGGFRALVARLVYTKDTFDGEIRPRSEPVIYAGAGLLSQKQVNYLGVIRFKVGVEAWNAAKKRLGVKTSGTEKLTKVECQLMIDWYEENYPNLCKPHSKKPPKTPIFQQKTP